MSESDNRRDKLTDAQRALLAQRLRGRQTTQPATLPRKPADAPPIASAGQGRLWALHQLNPDSPAYHMVTAIRLRGTVDQTRLQTALATISARHIGLRTGFIMIDGQLQQQVTDSVNLPLIHETIAEDQINDRIRELARLPFDLTQPPLIRAHLLTIDAGDAVFVLVVHHIISDEWANGVLLRDLASAYNGDSSAPAPTFTPLDYAHWQSGRADELQPQIDFWWSQLDANAEPLQLPTVSARPPVQTTAGYFVQHTLPPDLSAQVNQLSRSHNTTPFITLTAAFRLLLYHLTGQTDFAIGTPVANRAEPELRDLVAFCLNTVALRAPFDPDAPFTDNLDAERTTALSAYDHADIGFDEVVKALKPRRDPAYSPVFQVMSVWNEGGDLPDFDGLTAELLTVDYGVSKFDLTLFAGQAGDRLTLALEANRDLFTRDTVAHWLTLYETLLRGFVAQPTAISADIALLTDEQRAQLLDMGRGTVTDTVTDQPIFELIAEHITRMPDAPAIVTADETLTYAQVGAQSAAIARRLRDTGVQSGEFVGLCVDRSPLMITAILGILKAGAAYVPIDPMYPPERIAYLIADAGLKRIATTSDMDAPFGHAQRLNLDEPAPPSDAPLLPVTADQFAYMIYTSGSTGQPKGVPVTHRQLVHSTRARDQVYANAPERFMLLSSFAFDSSIVGIFWPLCAGGAVVLPPPDGERDVAGLARLIADCGVTHTLMLPSLYRILLDYAPPQQVRTLKTAIVAGEACPVALVRSHFVALPSAELVNEYGPTEGTVWATSAHITPDAERITIGQPIPNVTAYVVNERGQLVPQGVAGELWIGGAGVTGGYHNQPQLTAERFIDNPFGDGRVYRTGDRVRWLADGTLDFLGRVDFQVKISGYRIEPDEIAAVLQRMTGVQTAAVIAVADTTDMTDTERILQAIDQQGAFDLLDEIAAMDAAQVAQILQTITGEGYDT